MSKVPATIMTGFLGAGKTTLIRRLLAARSGIRFALIVNEFGDLGIDGEILRGGGLTKSCDAELIELANGCICCTVAEEFQPAMETLLAHDPPPDHILIETSGLALPQPLVQAFNWPGIAGRVTVDGVVCVVDGPALLDGRYADNPDAVIAQRLADDSLNHETPLSELFADQLSCADLVIINKADPVSLPGVDSLKLSLAGHIRNGVGILTSRNGQLDPDVLLGLDLAAETGPASHHHHHHDDHGHGAFESITCPLPEFANVETLRQRVRDVIAIHDLLRLKGFVAISGKSMRLVVQAVGPRLETYFDRPFAEEETRQGQLVAIGLAGIDRAALTDALQS